MHFVGHSLGGLVLYRYFEELRDARDGRVVLLGSPTVKSRTAERVGSLPLLSSLIGRLVTDELVKPCAREWRSPRELGLIAGTRPMGLGRFFASSTRTATARSASARPNYPGTRPHVTLPVSHMGMLMSRDVARQVGEFLAHGRFAARP